MGCPVKTSVSDPLRIAEVSPVGAPGVIGLTLCPGKKDPAGGWDRDLEIDVAVISDWRADVVVSLIETHEFEFLGVTDLPDVVEEHGMRWMHLPIVDLSVPNQRFQNRWAINGADLRQVVRSGGRVLLHCRGGLGRAGMIAARLLVELGMEPGKAIQAVRRVRPGAIETAEQERHVLACWKIADRP
jgi:ADP-ribosyl-[dinitrogen reductase] hydrolase